MQLSEAPVKLQQAFATAGSKNTIPQTTGTPGAASYAAGFPPVTMEPVSGGGIPPSGLDFNGIFNEGSSVIEQWASIGAGWQYDSVFSGEIGGYPQGTRLLSANGTFYWLSIVDNNTTDPDTGGAGWLPLKKAVASVYASAQQTLASANSKVLWNTVESDFFGLWNAGSQRFQALWAGLHRVSGSIYLPAPSGQNLSASIYKNGTLAKLCSQFPQVSNVPLVYSVDAIINCAIGDYLEVFMNVPTPSVLAGQVGSNEAYVYGQIEFLG